MQPRMKAPCALVLGESGAIIGSEVVRLLAAAGVPTAFTWHKAKERALGMAAELSSRPVQVDLSDPSATRRVIRGLVWRKGIEPMS